MYRNAHGRCHIKSILYQSIRQSCPFHHKQHLFCLFYWWKWTCTLLQLIPCVCFYSDTWISYEHMGGFAVIYMSSVRYSRERGLFLQIYTLHHVSCYSSYCSPTHTYCNLPHSGDICSPPTHTHTHMGWGGGCSEYVHCN